MKITSYMDEKFIFTGLDFDTKEEMIKEIIRRVSERDENFRKSKTEIEEIVLHRESELSTAMGYGVAIPHARVESYDDFIIAVGVNKKEIDCKTIYHKKDKVKYFFLIISSVEKNQLILKSVPAIIRMFMNMEFNKAIYGKEIVEAEDILKVMEKFDKESSEGIEAQDIMRVDIKPALLDDTMQNIAARFIKEEVDGLAVIDENGKFIGDITEEELIMFGLPKYAIFMKDLNFVRNSEQFEEYFKNEKNIKVRDIHEAFKPIIVSRKTSVIEISFLMVNNKVPRIYVVEEGKYYGTVYKNDIIKKVLHI